MKISRDTIEWAPLKNSKTGEIWRDDKGNPHYWKYISFAPNWLSKDCRYWGYEELPYDCQIHKSFGFWYFNFSWSF